MFKQARSRFEQQHLGGGGQDAAARPLLPAGSANASGAAVGEAAGRGPLLAGTKLWERGRRALPTNASLSNSPLLVGPPASHSVQWGAQGSPPETSSSSARTPFPPVDVTHYHAWMPPC